MKKIFALLVITVLGVGGFMWWKRNQVIAANEVKVDPWPAAVAPVQIPVVEPTDKNSNSKKSTAKKTAPKKVAQELD